MSCQSLNKNNTPKSKSRKCSNVNSPIQNSTPKSIRKSITRFHMVERTTTTSAHGGKSATAVRKSKSNSRKRCLSTQRMVRKKDLQRLSVNPLNFSQDCTISSIVYKSMSQTHQLCDTTCNLENNNLLPGTMLNGTRPRSNWRRRVWTRTLL